MEPADRGFVSQHWAESFEHAHAAGPFPPKLYYAAMRETLDGLFARPDCQVWLAHDTEDANKLIGFLCIEKGPFHIKQSGGWKRYDEDAIHYVYVRQAQRGGNVAKALLAAAQVSLVSRYLYSIRTPDGQDFSAHLRMSLKYEPRILRFPKVRDPRQTGASNKTGYVARGENEQGR